MSLKDNSQHKILSIRISTDGFYFSTHLCNVRKEFINTDHFMQLRTELENFLKQQTDVESLEVDFETPKFALFPPDYASAEADFAQLFEVSADEKILQCVLPQNILMLFAVNEQMWSYFLSHFKNIKFRHSLTSVFEKIDAVAEPKKLYLDVYSDKLYAVISENGKVIFANSFAYDSDEMFVYQVANIFVQFSLNQQEMEVNYTDFDIAKAKKKLLQKYVKRLIF